MIKFTPGKVGSGSFIHCSHSLSLSFSLFLSLSLDLSHRLSLSLWNSCHLSLVAHLPVQLDKEKTNIQATQTPIKTHWCTAGTCTYLFVPHQSFSTQWCAMLNMSGECTGTDKEGHKHHLWTLQRLPTWKVTLSMSVSCVNIIPSLCVCVSVIKKAVCETKSYKYILFMEHHHKRITSSSPITNNHMVQGSHAHCGTVGLHSEITHPVEQGSHTPYGTGDLHSDINPPVVQGIYSKTSPCCTGITCPLLYRGSTLQTYITLLYRDHMHPCWTGGCHKHNTDTHLIENKKLHLVEDNWLMKKHLEN